jgi:hypothetical protein
MRRDPREPLILASLHRPYPGPATPKSFSSRPAYEKRRMEMLATRATRAKAVIVLEPP